MDVNTLYHRTVEFFADRVNAVRDDQWGDPDAVHRVDRA